MPTQIVGAPARAFLSFIDFNMDIVNQWVRLSKMNPLFNIALNNSNLDEIYSTIISRAYKNSGYDEYAF